MNYTRTQALTRIGEFLASHRRADESLCQTAARFGLYCRRFDRWPDEQLRQLYPWLARRVPRDLPRAEFLKLIVGWDNARMIVTDAATPCDERAGNLEHCLGLDRLSTKQIHDLFPDLFQPADEIADR